MYIFIDKMLILSYFHDNLYQNIRLYNYMNTFVCIIITKASPKEKLNLDDNNNNNNIEGRKKG